MTWLTCPKCGSPLGLQRMGKVGVPDSRLGKRHHIPDSNRVRCTFCSVVFRAKGATMWETWGKDGENYW